MPLDRTPRRDPARIHLCRSGLPRAGAVAILSLAMLALGADPPEVVRLRVPADRVTRSFPPGSALRRMPLEDFDTLAAAAEAGARAAVAESGMPRVLRARHEALWRDGVLSGRSEF